MRPRLCRHARGAAGAAAVRPAAPAAPGLHESDVPVRPPATTRVAAGPSATMSRAVGSLVFDEDLWLVGRHKAYECRKRHEAAG